MINKTIGFTGTRNGLTPRQAFEVAFILNLYSKDYDTFTHGDCIGSDIESESIAISIGYKIKIRPCTIRSMRAFSKNGIMVAEPEQPLDRNKKIVDDSSIIIACPKEQSEILRSGTWSTIRYVKKNLLSRNIIMYIIFPDGSIKEYGVDKR